MIHLLILVRWLFPFTQGLGLGVIAMLLHECGHLLASLAFGVRVKNVGVKWNKGLYTVRDPGSNWQNLGIALAGPSVNLVLFTTAARGPLFALANLCYFLANVLPIEGSDGYRIAACWRRIRTGEVAR